jgi:hypothetical protein
MAGRSAAAEVTAGRSKRPREPEGMREGMPKARVRADISSSIWRNICRQDVGRPGQRVQR